MPEQTSTKIKLKYTGESYESKDPNYCPYIPNGELIEAVELAIDLKRPLLLEGEPGCGKTRLAEAIAYEFTQKYGAYLEAGKTWPIYTWNVKSTERARDGLYTFDGVARLRDAQLLSTGAAYLDEDGTDTERKKLLAELKDPTKTKYINYGAFGTVLKDKFKYPIRPILLIDEIDKADNDFPNDLLLEIDRLKFEVKETGKEHSKENEQDKPIIIITSNCERALSEAFLRRCFYYYLGFPDREKLTKIIHSRFGKMPEYSQLVHATILRLSNMRKILEQQPGSKLPGTGEVLNLIEALQRHSESEALEKLENLALQSPLLGIVLKTQQDWKFYRENLNMQVEDND
jgi:MoxR-like ATPase